MCAGAFAGQLQPPQLTQGEALPIVATTTVKAGSAGQVVQVLGPAVDVQFDEAKLPQIHNAIIVTSEGFDVPDPINVTLEVQQHLGEGRVRCVAMEPTDGMVRGMKATDTGAPISVPVGRQTLGRVINVLGRPVDKMGEIKSPAKYPIHRAAPAFDQQNVNQEMFETGIKVIDLLEPYLKGGKTGLFGGAGVGKTVIMADSPCSPAWVNVPAKETICGWKCRSPALLIPRTGRSRRPRLFTAR
jgi:flagellar biosynthesis/type III secretory pathway ATPase